MNDICVIGVYFGIFPNYFPLWLRSCTYNPTIDFLIFTDNTEVDTPKNVKLIPYSLDTMREQLDKLLGFRVSLERPYKCCDYKPLYGLLFSEWIRQYSFWGHCDFDLIFGDLRSFINQCEIEKYDKFLTLGHLSFYKNTPEVNKRFMCDGGSRSYKEAFTTNESCCFDEMCGMLSIYKYNNFSMFEKRVFADITPIHHRFSLSEMSYTDKKDTNYNQQIFYWKNGKVYRDYIVDGKLFTEEYMYIHFRSRPNFEVPQGIMSANEFFITCDGFIDKNGATTQNDINRLNHYNGVREWFELRKYYFSKLKERINRKLKTQLR